MFFSMDFMAFFQPPWNLREQQQVSTKIRAETSVIKVGGLGSQDNNGIMVK